MTEDRQPEHEILDRSSVPGSLHRDYLEARAKMIESVDYLSLDRIWPGVQEWLESCSAINHTFLVTMRKLNHPITKGVPNFWMHGRDECYSMLRGPAEGMTILATACDTPALQKAGRNEPMLMVIDYHKGRIFHTTLGHDQPAFECVGFIVTFLRGTEWAATGKVTQEIPKDFPGAEKTSARAFELKQPQ